MDQLLIEDTLISLFTKRKDCLRRLLADCTQRIKDFARKEESLQGKTAREYLGEIEGRREEHQRQKAEEMRQRKELSARRAAEREKQKSRLKAREELQAKEDENRLRKKRKEEQTKDKKQRASMVIHIDDMSFCIDQDELKQVAGEKKDVNPAVQSVLEKMNELLKQLK